jgi:signal transduction histidine kinase
MQFESQAEHAQALQRVDGLFAECGVPVPVPLRDRALRVAHAVADSSPSAAPVIDGIVVLGFVTELLVALEVDLAARPASLDRLVAGLAELGIPPIALGRDALGAQELLQLPTAVSFEVELKLLLALSDANSASLWTVWSGGDLRQISHVGKRDADPAATRLVARRLLAGDQPKASDGRDLIGVLIDRWDQPAAALVTDPGEAPRVTLGLLLAAASPMLTALLERQDLIGRSSSSEQAVVATSERRLARLRFDLHDGPQQDLMLLAEDLRLFQSQLAATLDGNDRAGRLLGRIEDLQARLVALDGDLRRISAATQSPLGDTESLPEALGQLVDSLAARSGIDTELRVDGALTGLTDSQHIALLGLVREALNNARQHSEATRVTVEVHGGPQSVHATVTDNGRGFEPESTLLRAAREGHLGLVGMHERVRLLGGKTEIDSRPGGPTVISTTLPSGIAIAPPPTGLSS